MTKYQRGDPVQGWNDCPSIMMSSNRSVSSSSIGKTKRVHRVVSNASDCSTQSSAPSTGLSTPPLRPRSVVEPELVVSSSKAVTVEEVLPKLESVLNHPSSLPQTEFNHYKDKISSSVHKLNQEHISFLSGVLDKTSELIDSGVTALKKEVSSEILNFMMYTDGVSKWCTPLRKVIEKLDI